MTRKDYILIAAALAYARNSIPEKWTDIEQEEVALQAHEDACFAVAHALANDNPRFDRERFLKACGVQS